MILLIIQLFFQYFCNSIFYFCDSTLEGRTPHFAYLRRCSSVKSHSSCGPVIEPGTYSTLAAGRCANYTPEPHPWYNVPPLIKHLNNICSSFSLNMIFLYFLPGMSVLATPLQCGPLLNLERCLESHPESCPSKQIIFSFVKTRHSCRWQNPNTVTNLATHTVQFSNGKKKDKTLRIISCFLETVGSKESLLILLLILGLALNGQILRLLEADLVLIVLVLLLLLLFLMSVLRVRRTLRRAVMARVRTAAMKLPLSAAVIRLVAGGVRRVRSLVEQAVVFRPLVVLPLLLLLLPASCNKQGESLVISPNFIILKRLDGSEARPEAGIERGGWRPWQGRWKDKGHGG
jgi:hypothetical protein